MARVFPTESIRYSGRAGDVSKLIAPPYDVISHEQASLLRARSPFNAVHLILPEGEAPGRYERAADLMEDWLASGMLIRGDAEGVFAYEQTFSHAGGSVSRQALLAAVGLAEFEAREILPHERTHRGPKEDRLALMMACKAQLSPIFFIGRDGPGKIFALLAETRSIPPILEATTDDGIGHTLRPVPADLSGPLLEAVASDDLLIADGHHRYETALELARQLPARAGARRVLAAIVSEHDPGLIVQATHRRLSGLPPGWLESLDDSFDVQSAPADPLQLADLVPLGGASTLGVCAAGPSTGDRRSFLLRPRDEAARRAGLSPAEARLASVLLDRLVLQPLTGHDADAAAAAGTLSYHQDPAAAAERLDEVSAAFLLPPIDMESLWEVVREGGRLPPKSTYFAPKMPSGLIFRPL